MNLITNNLLTKEAVQFILCDAEEAEGSLRAMAKILGIFSVVFILCPLGKYKQQNVSHHCPETKLNFESEVIESFFFGRIRILFVNQKIFESEFEYYSRF